MELRELRNQVDTIDEEILNLFIERMKLVKQVAEFKKAHGVPVNAPERENEVLTRLNTRSAGQLAGVRLLYGIVMDLNKLNEYLVFPKDLQVPSGAGGASVRAILSDTPDALCRYVSPLAGAEVTISSIHSQSLPGGKLLVDLEIVGNTSQPNFAASLSVLSDTAERFTLL